MLKVNLPGEGEVVVAAAAASKGEVKESTGGVAHCISARVVSVTGTCIVPELRSRARRSNITETPQVLYRVGE